MKAIYWIVSALIPAALAIGPAVGDSTKIDVKTKRHINWTGGAKRSGSPKTPPLQPAPMEKTPPVPPPAIPPPAVAPVPSESAVLGAPNAPSQGTLAADPRSYVTYVSPFLKKDLEEVYKRSRVKGRLGFSVFSTRYGRTEAALNDTEWFTPASCLKLIVTAAALDTFPINFFPPTLMDVFGIVKGKTLYGKVRIAGEGDPNVSDRFFPDALSPLEPFMDSLKALGIDTVQGAIEVTDTFFTGPHRPDAWKQHHFNTWYGAEVSALSYNDNTFTLNVLPGAKPGAPAIAMIKPDVGYVRIINKAKTVAGGKRRIVPAQNPDSTVITLSGVIGNKAPGFQMVLPVRNPTQYFRASFLKSMAAHGIVMRPDSVPPLPPLVRNFRFTTAPLIDIVQDKST